MPTNHRVNEIAADGKSFVTKDVIKWQRFVFPQSFVVKKTTNRGGVLLNN